MPAVFHKFRPMEASASFEFTNPETGRKFIAPDMGTLVRRVAQYRADNQLPDIPQLKSVIENYLCHLPCNVGKCEPYQLKRGLMQYLKGGIALLSNLWLKNPVPLEEADRRSAICSTCVVNVFPDKGPFIKWADEIAEQTVGDKRSKHHDELGNCACCSCPLRAKIWHRPPFNLTESDAACMQAANPRCWQLEK